MRLDNYLIPGKDLKTTITLSIQSDEIRGTTSSSESAHLGFKPKKIL